MVHFFVCDSCLGQLECAWVVWLVVALAVCATGWHSVWPFEAVSLRDRSLTGWMGGEHFHYSINSVDFHIKHLTVMDHKNRTNKYFFTISFA